jgi:hypothetical protein
MLREDVWAEDKTDAKRERDTQDDWKLKFMNKKNKKMTDKRNE